MNRERWTTTALTLALLLVGALSWRSYLRPALDVEAGSLTGVPLQIDRWHGEEVPMRRGVERMLNADYNLQRSYVHPVGGAVWLYVGYYGTARGGRAEHTPWSCYPSNGWSIIKREVVNLPGGQDRRANELVVEKAGERRLVHFWYQSYRRTGMLGGLDQAFDRLLNRVLDGRADGALVRVSAPLDAIESEASTRARLISFAREVIPLLRQHWPEEREGRRL